ncbi:hypothetical protein EGI16_12140 [Chryseobacterium sp. G0240]|uniref:hypothetical protein n=1 Tax=Chryseobacterium sp. G0240 TaxID=2487066 RepID=UPI000F44D5E7|nr:hypothetical protein [Chryseobacterium sp. G0240]ROI02915.1 hypothetical protein EGI16_12140 [Chryseobacterium sp. G0240]
MLKQSNEREINEFTAQVLNFFNPKFEDPEIEEELARADILRFATRCELTSEEFLLALTLATEGKLQSAPDSAGNVENIKLYREIDIIKLGEVKAAYIRFKNEDEKYKKGKAEIKAFLNPPPVEITPEQKKEIRIKFLKEEYSRLQSKGEVLGSIQFYDLLRKGHKVVKIGFVEKFLQTVKLEEYLEAGRSTEVHKASSKRVIKKDPFLAFKELFVSSYITKMKLKDGTEEQWIEHWEQFRGTE